MHRARMLDNPLCAPVFIIITSMAAKVLSSLSPLSHYPHSEHVGFNYCALCHRSGMRIAWCTVPPRWPAWLWLADWLTNPAIKVAEAGPHRPPGAMDTGWKGRVASR